MKNFTFLILLVSLFNVGLAEQDTTAFETNSLIENVKHSKEFSIAKDSLTLKPFNYGTKTFSLEGEENANYISIKYSPRGENNWKTVSGQKEVAISKLKENSLFDYYIGTGVNQNDIAFESSQRIFNTFYESIFKNLSTKAKTESAVLMWGLNRTTLNNLIAAYPNASYTVKYNTKVGEKQHKADKKLAPWIKKENISIDEVSFKENDLSGGTNYVSKVGIDLGNGEVIWSKKSKFKAKRSWGIFKLLVLLGALGMFIFGMKNMSEGLQQAAGSRLRKMLGSITSNRIKGVITGFGITSIVQSSSVTTVMTVSFVNAGLLTLRQSAGVMMGANVGTTITAWLIIIFGFKMSLASYAYIFIAFGATMLFFGKGKMKYWGSALVGFALLFLGLDELKHSVPTLGADSSIVQFFIAYKNSWFGPIMFVFLGALVTVVVQSSSAAMALTMILVSGGVLPFEVASAMILGENIGTTITAELASLGGNVHAKRSARIHSLFNVIGVTWAILLFPFILKAIASFMDTDPYTDTNAANVGIAIFHTAFNLLNVVILLPFVNWLVSIAEKSVKSKGEEDEEYHLEYISAGMMSTPDLSISEAKKEISKFGKVTHKMNGFVNNLLVEKEGKKIVKLIKKAKKYEEITDRMELEIADYLAKVSQGEMSSETSVRIRGMLSMIGDLERIGDIYYQISKTIESKNERKIWFAPEYRDMLVELGKNVDEAFIIMNENLNADYSTVTIDSALSKEKDINALRDKIRKKHLSEIGKGDYDTVTATIYSNIFHSFEKVGDHIINVTEGLVGNMD
ncbi:MAG: Na/Pi cotransporter family protein [Flavobacteriales bacterium]